MSRHFFKRTVSFLLVLFSVVGTGALTGCRPAELEAGNDEIEALSPAYEPLEAREYMLPAHPVFLKSPLSKHKLDDLLQMLEEEMEPSDYRQYLHAVEEILVLESDIRPMSFRNILYLQRDGVEGLYSDPYGNFYFDQIKVTDPEIKPDMSQGFCIYLGSKQNRPDPAAANLPNNQTMTAMTHAGLFHFLPDGRVARDLVADLTSNPEQTIWRIKLRQDRFWSNQEPITTDDFIQTWRTYDRHLQTEPFRSFFDKFKRQNGALWLEADAQKTELVLHFKQPITADCLRSYLAQPFTYPVNATGISSEASLTELETRANTIFSGPYVVTHYRTGEVMELEPNPNYGGDKQRLPHIFVMLNSDRTMAYEAFQAGLLHVNLRPPVEKSAGLMRSQNPNLRLTPVREVSLLELNSQGSGFADLPVEQRVLLSDTIQDCIDYNAVLAAGQIPADSIVMEGLTDQNGLEFKKNDQTFIYPVDTGYFEKKQDSLIDVITHLRENGFVFDESERLVGWQEKPGADTEKLDLQLTMIVAADQPTPETIANMVRFCRSFGIEIKLNYVRQEVFDERYAEGDYDLAAYNYRYTSTLAEDALARWVKVK